MIGLVQLLGSVVATCIVEKTGRKARYILFIKGSADVVGISFP